MRYTLPQATGRLKKKAEFDSVFKTGVKFSNRYCIIWVSQAKEDHGKVAFVAGKKVGNSVKRNRSKRLLKEVYRKNRMNLKSNHNWIFIAKASAKETTEKDVSYHFKKGLQANGYWQE